MGDYTELIKELRENPANKRLMTYAADAIEELQGRAKVLEKVADKWCEAVPKWIPVTERLPEDIDENVLVCNEDYGISCLGFVTVATYGVSGWLECWERKTYLTAVTHWMPLPEPPKEEGERWDA